MVSSEWTRIEKASLLSCTVSDLAMASSSSSSSDRSRLLLLFDVDGTLTPHRRPMRPEVRDFLLGEVLPRATVGLVSGSDVAKLTWQVGGPEVAGRFDFVFSENGLVAHRKGGELIGEQSIAQHLGEERVQRLINFALGYMSGLELPCKRGNFVEFRTGLINLSPVGRSCSQQQREEFARLDEERGIRRDFRRALMQEFPLETAGLQFAIGGQISVDVFPAGWDKRFCLRYVEQDFKQIHFFGDRTEEGGNDRDIFLDDRTIGHAVISPEDTVEQTKKILGL